METKYNEKDIQMVQQLLQKLNEKKVTRHTPKSYRIGEILSINTRRCTYVGNHHETKTHIQVKFTSPDEHGMICVSVLLNKYQELMGREV